MPRPAIFFDRDNTLIACDDYLGDPLKVVLVDGAADAIARVRELGFAVVVISNQSGVARGMFSEAEVQAVNARLEQMLRAQNPRALIDRHEYCPFHPQAAVATYRKESDCRKPAPGMILSAAKELDLDLVQSWVIGDAPRDIEAGRAAGCRTILFTDPRLGRSPAADAPLRVKPTYMTDTLREAVDLIAKAESPPPTPKLEATAEQILHELRRQREQPHVDFSVTKLLGGIAQVVSIAVVFLAYLNRNDASFLGLLIFGVWVQCLTVALLVMGRGQ